MVVVAVVAGLMSSDVYGLTPAVAGSPASAKTQLLSSEATQHKWKNLN